MQRFQAITAVTLLATAAVASALCSDPQAPDVAYKRGDPIPSGAWVYEIPGYTGQLGGATVRHNGNPYIGTVWLSNPGSGPNGADYCLVGVVNRQYFAGFCDTIGAAGITLAGAPPTGCAWKFFNGTSATDPVAWKYYEPVCAGTGVTGVGFLLGGNCRIATAMASNTADPWTASLSAAELKFKMYEADHCIAGYENFDPVALTCTKCQPGNYRATASVSPLNCIPCAGGNYTAAEGATTCSACAIGTYSPPGIAASVCTTCAAGKFSSVKGMSSCSDCDAGTYSPPGAAASMCTECAAGTFANAKGSTSCSACGAGSFSNVKGASSCKPCAVGMYSNSTGSIACTACAGNTIPNAGATACVACASGFTAKDGKCMLGVGPIVGIAVGGAVLIIVIAVIAKCCCCKKKPETSKPYADNAKDVEMQ